MKDKWFYLAIAVVVLTAWMLRWGIIDATGPGVSHKLDRWTGTSYVCRLYNFTDRQCRPHENISDD